MNKHQAISYIELPANNISATKEFFTQVFEWVFQDFGPEYCAFREQNLEGGFYKSDLSSNVSDGAALVIFYSQDLEATQDKINNADGIIVKSIFDFPGGRRFHFTEPSGNEFAVWSDIKK